MYWCLENPETSEFSLIPIFDLLTKKIDDTSSDTDFYSYCCLCVSIGIWTDILTLCPRCTCYNIGKISRKCHKYMITDKQPTSLPV